MNAMSKLVILLVVSLLVTLPAASHHSAAVFFHLDREISIDGVVTAFQLGNPHARIYLTVKDENGIDQPWMAEGGSRTVMLRKGWTGEEVKPGDPVTIIGHPSRDGSNVIHWEWLLTPDGRRLWGEDIEPDRLEELRRRRQ
jgi:hypothetical protein